MCICAGIHDKITTQMTTLLVSHDQNLQTIYKMGTRCCIFSSVGSRIFHFCEMFIHNKRIKQMKPPTWSHDPGTIYRPATK